MISALDERPAIAVPTILHLPANVVSLAAAEEAIEWGDCYGLTLDADQRATLMAALGESSPGVWAASEVGDFKGRQAGKNDTIKVRQGVGVDLFGERLMIHTAHEWPTAKEDFLRLVAIYESFDDLRRTVAHIRYGNGENAIEFTAKRNHARIMYRSRTTGAGRGFAEAEVIFYDEAQHLKPEHLAASLPTTLISRNPQSWYSGSGGLDFSAIAWAMRRRAILGDGSAMAYTENTAQVVSVVDGNISMTVPDDMLAEDVLRIHPGYANGRTRRARMESLFRQLGPGKFAREILCVWDLELGANPGAVPLERWGQLTDGDSLPTDETLRLALDCPPDRASASFAIAGKRDDNLYHVSVRLTVPPHEMGHLVETAKRLAEGHKTPLIIAPNSPALAWSSELLAAGVPLDLLTPAEYAQACGLMMSKVTEGSLRHRGIPEMVNAVGGLAVRKVGDVETWSRRSSTANISPFVAATAALVRVAAAPTEVFAGSFSSLEDYL